MSEAEISVDDISVCDLLVRVAHVDHCGFYLWGDSSHCTGNQGWSSPGCRQSTVVVTPANLEQVRKEIIRDTRRELSLLRARRN